MQALQLHQAFSFDLHVLGMPPAFILSQDQTLQKKIKSYFRSFVLFFPATQIDVLLSFQRTLFFFVPFRNTLINITSFDFIVNRFFYIFLTFFILLFLISSFSQERKLIILFLSLIVNTFF